MPEVNNVAELEVLLDKCQTALGYRFRDIELLAMCLTHASTARTRLHSNERLEFLGDAILGAIVCEALYHRFPEASEGELTRVKSIVVSRATCATMAARVQLEQFVLVGKGLDQTGRIPPSILAGTFEGLVAGIYLDGGVDAVRTFLKPLLAPEIESAAARLHEQNFKSLLQHIAQKKLGVTPIYRLLEERGPDHSKVFHISAVVGGQVFPAAWGANKKEAEQTAALHALEALLAEDDLPLLAEPFAASSPDVPGPDADRREADGREQARNPTETEPFGLGIESN
jgi:ribonuclease-3